MTFNVETNDTPFGELSDEDAAALFIAWRHGRRISSFVNRFNRLDWVRPDWLPIGIYSAEPLPLIPAGFDFAALDPKWRWCAADENGEAFVYAIKPKIAGVRWIWPGFTDCRRIDGLFPSYVRGTVPWQETLIERR